MDSQETRSLGTTLSAPRSASENVTFDGEKLTYDLPPILTVEEAASFLRMSPKTVYAAVTAKEIPARRIGRRVVILRDALLDWLRPNGSGLSSRRRRS